MTIIIPDEIVARPDLMLVERIALAHLHDWPGGSNARLAAFLGFSKRGVEALLKRLRERRLIRQVGKGRARRLYLRFHVERRTACGHATTSQSHIDCGSEDMIEPATLDPDTAPCSTHLGARFSRKAEADIHAVRRFLVAKGILRLG